MPSQQSLSHVDMLETLYRESVVALRGALSRYIANGERPDPAGIDPAARGETLSVAEFVRLANRLGRADGRSA